MRVAGGLIVHPARETSYRSDSSEICHPELVRRRICLTCSWGSLGNHCDSLRHHTLVAGQIFATLTATVTLARLLTAAVTLPRLFMRVNTGAVTRPARQRLARPPAVTVARAIVCRVGYGLMRVVTVNIVGCVVAHRVPTHCRAGGDWPGLFHATGQPRQ